MQGLPGSDSGRAIQFSFYFPRVEQLGGLLDWTSLVVGVRRVGKGSHREMDVVSEAVVQVLGDGDGPRRQIDCERRSSASSTSGMGYLSRARGRSSASLARTTFSSSQTVTISI
jgi:hypothetical protein